MKDGCRDAAWLVTGAADCLVGGDVVGPVAGSTEAARPVAGVAGRNVSVVRLLAGAAGAVGAAAGPNGMMYLSLFSVQKGMIML